MNILINQRFGIGDCIYSMTIARKWMAEGHSITWPVLPQFVSQLQRAYPDVEWLDCNSVKADYNKREEHDWGKYRVVPLAWANEIMKEPYTNCMRNKYDLLQLDYQDWRKGAMWERDERREAALLRTVGCKGFTIVNDTFGSDGKLKVSIPQQNKEFRLSIKDGISLFDYAILLEQASEIHTVSTSIIYLLEMLDITCPIHLYPRPTDPKFKQVSYLFTKPYILHESTNS